MLKLVMILLELSVSVLGIYKRHSSDRSIGVWFELKCHTALQYVQEYRPSLPYKRLSLEVSVEKLLLPVH